MGRGGRYAVKLDGSGIIVRDMAAMVRFCRDVPGFEIREDENAANVYPEKDGTLFLLYRRTDIEKMANRRYE
jgi:lactoylglutathione lyase